MTTSNTPGGGKAHDGADATTSFRETATAQDAGHVISITARGVPYSRCRQYSRSCDNGLGQLGRGGDPHVLLPIVLSVDDDDDGTTTTTTTGRAVGGDRGGGAATAVAASAAHAYAGGFADRPYSTRRDISGSAGATGGSSSASARRAPGRAGTRGRGGSCGRIAFAGTFTSSNC